MSLTFFAKNVGLFSELKKPVIDGNEIPRHINWKESFVTRVTKESFNGLAFTNFVFCASQEDYNGGESWCTVKFAQNCGKMNSKVCRPKPKDIKALLKKAQDEIVQHEKTIENHEKSARRDPRAINLRK